MRTILCGIIAVLVLSGCSEEIISKEKYTTLIGRPISIALGVGDSIGTIAVVLEVGNKFILTAGYEYNSYITKAAALISSEIAKGYEGKVELRGYYTKEGEFVIKAVKVNGLSVEF